MRGALIHHSSGLSLASEAQDWLYWCREPSLYGGDTYQIAKLRRKTDIAAKYMISHSAGPSRAALPATASPGVLIPADLRYWHLEFDS